jgi:hypothetical protein
MSNDELNGIDQIYLSKTAKKSATTWPLSEKIKEVFYARYGYVALPNTSLMHEICKFI